MTVLDGFRRARDLADYEGAEVEEAKARECIEWAAVLIAEARTGLQICAKKVIFCFRMNNRSGVRMADILRDWTNFAGSIRATR